MRFSSKVEENSVVHINWPRSFYCNSHQRTVVRNVNGNTIPGSGLVTERTFDNGFGKFLKIIAANRRASNSHAHIAQHQEVNLITVLTPLPMATTKPISILDFVTDSQSIKQRRRYLPSVRAAFCKNGQWDTVNAANGQNIQPYYHCYNSGQGCGNETTGLTLSGNMQVVSEGQFSGYKVIQSNADLNNLFLNADIDGKIQATVFLELEVTTT